MVGRSYAARFGVVGGLIAIASAISNSFVVDNLKAKSEHKQLRREKLEELGALVYETRHWMNRYRRHVMFNEERPREPRPLIRPEMLHVEYFPELKEPFSTFFIAVSDYTIWIGEGANYKTTLTSGFGDEYNRGLEKVYEAMLNASNVLMEHVSRLMKTLA